jgi:uncharacterized membrane protein YkoI
MRSRAVILGAVLLLLAPAVGGQEQPLPDFERAQEAVERGEILPLAEILGVVQEAHPGRVIEVELEFADGLRIYEVELITPEGRLIEVDVNAATGEILAFEDEDDDGDD